MNTLALNKKEHRLEAGVLSLHYPQSQPEIFQVAERINSKRAFVFVSNVLGRHIPVSPKMHNDAARSLARKASEHIEQGPVLVMGYAETAVGFGAAVARSLRMETKVENLFYLPTTRHPVKEHDWLVFEEGHSHATDQRVMLPYDPEVLTLLENQNGQIKVNREVRFFKSHPDLDNAYNWGMRWKAGRK